MIEFSWFLFFSERNRYPRRTFSFALLALHFRFRPIGQMASALVFEAFKLISFFASQMAGAIYLFIPSIDACPNDDLRADCLYRTYVIDHILNVCT